MRIVVFQAHPTEEHKVVLESFARGCGAEIRPASDYEPCDVAVIFGMVKWDWFKSPYPKSFIAGFGEGMSIDGTRKLLKVSKKMKPGASAKKAEIVTRHKGPILVIEKGYVRRNIYWSVGWNGINGRAEFCSAGAPDDRWRKLGVELEPWRDRDGPILVCGQVPWDVSVQGTDHIMWCRKTTKALVDMGYDVVFRPHPLATAKGVKYDVYGTLSKESLATDLGRARCVITYNSNTGVDAVIAGVPVISFDAGSMVRRVSGCGVEDIESPFMKEREQWAAEIAYSQWTTHEMQTGETWSTVRAFLSDV